MIPLPPAVFAALAALAVILPTILVAAGVVLPVLRPWIKASVSEKKRADLFHAVKGAYLVVADIAKRTPTSLDDNIASLLHLVELELGATLSDSDKRRALAMAASMQADPKLPVLGDIAANKVLGLDKAEK